MTRQQVITLFFGFLICFCLFGKQVAQDYDLTIDLPSVQDVVAEDAGADDLIDLGDDLLVIPIVFVAPFFFFLVPFFISLRYLQPVIPLPQRPPSI
jgi:hypothetical protein